MDSLAVPDNSFVFPSRKTINQIKQEKKTNKQSKSLTFFFFSLFPFSHVINHMSENEMIIVDGESPPPLTSLSIETPEAIDTTTTTADVTIKEQNDETDNDGSKDADNTVAATPTPTVIRTPPASSPPALLPSSLDPNSKIARLISKEANKLLKRTKTSKNEMVSDMNDDTPSTMSTDNNNSSSDEVDEVDTDDLLDQADLLPPLRNKRINMTTTQVVNSTLGKGSGRGRKRRRGRGVAKTKTKAKKLNTTKRGRVKVLAIFIFSFVYIYGDCCLLFPSWYT